MVTKTNDSFDRVPPPRHPSDLQASCITLDTAIRCPEDESMIFNTNQQLIPSEVHQEENHYRTHNNNTVDHNHGESNDSDGGITFANQSELPLLPIPKLKDTLHKFLEFLEAIQTPEQHERAKQEVLHFIKGDGVLLQEWLIDYERVVGLEKGMIGSYVEEFWNDSHLVPDKSAIVLNLNPIFVLEDSPNPKHAKDHIRRASSLCFAAVKLAATIRNETMWPDTFRETMPLCMDQFKAVFGAARVPRATTPINKETVDDAKRATTTHTTTTNVHEDDIDVYPYANHVIVMCQNQLYYFQAMWPDGCVAVDEEDVYEILSNIQRNAIQSSSSDENDNDGNRIRTSLGVLTTLPRGEWAEIRQKISSITDNEQYLTIIDSGLFVLVLDNVIPKSPHEAASNMLHGTHRLTEIDRNSNLNDLKCPVQHQIGSCCNRWYDKLQIIVCQDGTAGINFENSAIDGHTALRIASDIYAETVVNFAQSISRGLPCHKTIPHVIWAPVDRVAGGGGETSEQQGRRTAPLDTSPKKISLSIPDDIVQSIFHAEARLGDGIQGSDTRVLEFQEYGKAFITTHRISPDAYIQMSIMLAYYKMYGKVVCAYEPVLTKTFFHGRTEAMRPATVPVKKLCETFFHSKSTQQEKMAALREALALHTKLVKECAQGMGVDRHLFALMCLAEQQEQSDRLKPSLFQSEAWKMLNHTVLATANCGNPALRLFGFGPVVRNGYGIGYIIKEHSVHFSVSSAHRQTERFVRSLDGVLHELYQLVRAKSLVTSTMYNNRRNNSFRSHGTRSSPNNRSTQSASVQTLDQRPPSMPLRQADTSLGAIPMRGRKSDFADMMQSDHTYPTNNRGNQENSGGKQPPLSPTNINSNYISPSLMHGMSPSKTPKMMLNRTSLQKSAIVAAATAGLPLTSVHSTDHMPQVPQRRMSSAVFSGVSRRTSLSSSTLSASGVSLDFETALLATSDEDDDEEEGDDHGESTMVGSFF